MDQASRAPLGSDERTRLSLTKTSQTLGAPSARRARDESAKTGMAATVEAQAQNSLADLTGAKPMTSEPTGRDITGKLPSHASIKMRTRGAERSPIMRGRGVVRARGNRGVRGREAGESKSDHREQEQGEGEANSCGHGRREAAPDRGTANTERTRRRMASRRRPGNVRIGRRDSPRESGSSSRGKGDRRGNGSSQDVHKIPVLTNRERCSYSVGC